MHRTIVKYLVAALFVFAGCTYSFAQQRSVDSLRDLLKKDKREDTNRVKSLNQLSDNIWRIGNYDTSLIIANSALELAQKLNYKEGIAIAYHNMGNIYEGTGNYPKAMENSLRALTLKHEVGDRVGECGSLNNIALVYEDMYNYPKAIEYHTKALNLAIELKDTSDIATNLGNLGIVYDYMHNYKQALENEQKALEIFTQLGDEDGISINLGNIGEVYMHMGEYDKALDYDFRSLKIIKGIGEKYVIASTFETIGQVYTKQKKYGLAKAYLDSALTMGLDIKQKDIIRDSYFSLSSLDSATGNLAGEIENYKKYILFKDSLNNESNTKKMVQTEMTYEFEQKQAAQKAAQEKKDAVAEQNRKREALIRNFLLGGLLMFMVLAFYIYRGYKQKQAANVIITAQKEEVDKSRKKIVDSIKYAQKIQYSILPDPNEIKKYVSGYFACFLPKDIVSGDFYWFHHMNDVSYIAVVDCTGHGVPGACMSMLAHSFLNEIVIEQRITEPAQILATMHQLVFRTLHQEKGDEYSQDGMDISLVAINHKQNTATFAGAKNHGYIVDASGIKVLKATSKSIGGLSMTGEIEPTRQFKSETVELTKGMLLVLSTDGIIDQLNIVDEKFGKTRFNNLIQSLFNSTMEKGQELTESTVNEWKDNMHQLDDILLMGVRV